MIASISWPQSTLYFFPNRILGFSTTSWYPQRLSRAVMGLLYLLQGGWRICLVALNASRSHSRSVIAVEYGQSVIRPNHIHGKAGHRSGVQFKHVVSACKPSAYGALDTRAPLRTPTTSRCCGRWLSDGERHVPDAADGVRGKRANLSPSKPRRLMGGAEAQLRSV